MSSDFVTCTVPHADSLPLPIPSNAVCRSPASAAGLGKRRMNIGCTIASAMAKPRHAHERTRRARDADGRDLGRNRKAGDSGPVQSGGSVNEISLAAPGAFALRRLAAQLARYAPHDDVFPLRLPGTYAVRRSRLTTEPRYATISPALCVVAQGAKVVMLGREVLE